MTSGSVGMRRRWSAVLLALMLTPALAELPAPAMQPELASAGTLGEDLFVRSGSTGMVLVVVRGDETFFRGYGETAPGSAQAPGRESLLRLCSLTKIFTSDLLDRLSEQHAVRLSDSLGRYAPPGMVVPERGGPITLEDLATHTSGLPRELGRAPRGAPHFTYPDYATRWRWLPRQRLASVPGTAALYSNIGFDFLGDALASATHTQYAKLLDERTLKPLGMYGTTLFPDAAQCARLLVGSGEEGPCTATENTAGSSGLYSTATDMGTWLKYLLGADGVAGQDARQSLAGQSLAGQSLAGQSLAGQGAAAQAVYLLPKDLVSEKGLDHAGEPTGIGLGWIHVLGPGKDAELVEKTGGGAGFTTYIAINHSRRTALFLAATEGRGDSHLNLFNAANKVLLALAGLPPLPAEPGKQALPQTTRRRATRAGSKRARTAHPRTLRGL